MVSRELNDWLQVVGLFAVLGGLIFVGLQLRLDRRVALSEGAVAGLQAQVGFVDLLVQNSDVWLKGASGESLSPSEQHQFDELAAVYEFRYFTIWNTANQLGSAPPDRWVGEAALDFFDNPGLLAWWNKYLARLDQIDEDDGGEWVAAVEAELVRLEQEHGNR